MKRVFSIVVLPVACVISGCSGGHSNSPSTSSATPANVSPVNAASETAPKSSPHQKQDDQVVLPPSAPQLSSLSIEPAVKRQNLTARFTGRLTWSDDVTVRVFSPVSGRVLSIDGALGQPVKAGDVLTKVASTEYGQAQADALKAKADLVLAERTLKRVQELLSHGAAAQKDVDSAEDAFTTAQTEKQRADARLALYGGAPDSNNPQFLLKAPIDGVVVERNINPGQELRPDQMLANSPAFFAPLFVISDPKKLWLYLDVTEIDMAIFKPGMKLKLQTKAYPDRAFDGVIDFVGSSLDPATRTIRMRATVDNEEQLLKAEMYVTAEVSLGDASVANGGVDIPSRAIFLENNIPNVFVETGPGSFARRTVKLGPESDGHIAAISGIRAGERVVTQGCLLLRSLLENKE